MVKKQIFIYNSIKEQSDQVILACLESIGATKVGSKCGEVDNLLEDRTP